MKLVIAPDKFKGSLTARQVADRVAAGIAAVTPAVEVVTVPVADGGDGTVDAALAAGYARVPVRAEGPTGTPVDTAFAVRDGVAVVEMADVSGLRLLAPDALAPLTASSYGTGEVVAAALDHGCHTVVLGIGGSASTDGGAGLVQALGARLRDRDGAELPRGGAALAALDRLDLTGLHPALARTRVVVASDVDNPLLGPTGAAAVYGPQKGADRDQVVLLDAALALWADAVDAAVAAGSGGSQQGGPAPDRVEQGHPAALRATPRVEQGHPAALRATPRVEQGHPAALPTGASLRDRPGAGAAGGVGYAAMAVLGGALEPGIGLVLDLVGFADHLRGADLVVTGEGRLDEQTLHGKAPAGVAAAARAAGVPVVAVAGSVDLPPERLRAAGIDAAYALTDLEPDVARCLADAGPLLERLARDRLAASDGVIA